jgi:uncharacterized BrkB/YihY/UPF0761 family membrane protein
LFYIFNIHYYIIIISLPKSTLGVWGGFVLGTAASGGFTKVERGLCNCYETPSRWRQRRFKQVKKKKLLYSFCRDRVFSTVFTAGVIF